MKITIGTRNVTATLGRTEPDRMGNSLGEQIQGSFPDAHVVKALPIREGIRHEAQSVYSDRNDA